MTNWTKQELILELEALDKDIAYIRSVRLGFYGAIKHLIEQQANEILDCKHTIDSQAREIEGLRDKLRKQIKAKLIP